MTGRWLSVIGAILLLAAPGLYEAGSHLGDAGLLPSVFPPERHAGCCGRGTDTRFHRVPAALFGFVHLPVAIALLGRRKWIDPASLVLLFLFIPAHLNVLTDLFADRSLRVLAWISLLGAAGAVGVIAGFQGEIRGAAAAARLAIGMLLVQAHALIWHAWGANPLVAGAWFGILGGMMFAAGEVIASRLPASSASASPPCPPLSRRTSWRRA